MLDLKIIGGELFDGTGSSAENLDVGVSDGEIEILGDLSSTESEQTIDARGCVVCPGFIDAHSHSDAYLLIEPSAQSKIFQGVTTEVVGNCGCSAAPRGVKARMPSDWQEFEYPGSWQTIAEYRLLLESVSPAINLAMLVGHNNLRATVMGYRDRRANADELQSMRRCLAESLDSGAIGLSTGLLYSPGMFAGRDEVLALAEVVAAHDGIYTSHMRSEGSALLDAVDETIGVGSKTDCRVEISHLKTAGSANWGKIDALLGKIDAARTAGVSVAADRYPYTAACTDLDVILPDWAGAGERTEIIARLRDSSQRRRIREELLAGRPADYWERVVIGSTFNPDNAGFSGQPLVAIAEELAMEPVDAALHLMESDELHTGGIFFGMCEANLQSILAQPYVMIGSDGSLRAPTGPLSHDHPHPRNYGAFTRFLKMASTGETVELPEAIRKMTSLPASHFGLERRGRLQPGFHADVAVIDLGRLKENTTYANPHRLSDGIRALVVNGTPVILDGEMTAKRDGMVL